MFFAGAATLFNEIERDIMTVKTPERKSEHPENHIILVIFMRQPSGAYRINDVFTAKEADAVIRVLRRLDASVLIMELVYTPRVQCSVVGKQSGSILRYFFKPPGRLLLI